MPKKSPEFIETVYTEIGKRIRWLREQRDWSSKQLGDALGLHMSVVSTWETAKARVRFSDLVRIAHVFGVTLELFLADIDPADCQPSAALTAARKQRSNRKKKGREK